MLDVDFLRKPKLKGHIVHLVRDGCFRAEVAAWLRAEAGQRGWLWRTFDPADPSVSSGGALYDRVVLSVDLDVLGGSDAGASALAAVVRRMGEDADTTFHLHGRPGPLCRSAAWEALLGAGGVEMLHEPELGPAAVAKLLDHVGPRLACPPGEGAARAALERGLRDWVARGEMGLPEFLSRLDVLSACCIGPDGAFDDAAFALATGPDARGGGAAWTEPLARFLRARTAAAAVALLAEVDRALHAEGAGMREVVRGVYRATFDLAAANDAANPGEGRVPDGWTDARWQRCRAHRALPMASLLRWQVLFAHHEPLLLARGLVGWAELLRHVRGVEKS